VEKKFPKMHAFVLYNAVTQCFLTKTQNSNQTTAYTSSLHSKSGCSFTKSAIGYASGIILVHPGLIKFHGVINESDGYCSGVLQITASVYKDKNLKSMWGAHQHCQ
jgi:hypothetical protein